jgi:hypothetical protein
MTITTTLYGTHFHACHFFSVQEIISGVIVIVANGDVRHDGITLVAEGSVNLQLSSKNVGIFEAFYNSVKVCARQKIG